MFNFLNKPPNTKMVYIVASKYGSDEYKEVCITIKHFRLDVLILTWDKLRSQIPEDWEAYNIDFFDDHGNILYGWKSFKWNPEKPDDSQCLNDIIKDLKK